MTCLRNRVARARALALAAAIALPARGSLMGRAGGGRKRRTAASWSPGPSFAHLRDWIVKNFEADTRHRGSSGSRWSAAPARSTASLMREADAGKHHHPTSISAAPRAASNFTRKPDVVVNLREVVSLPDVLDGSKWRGGGLRVQTGTDDDPRQRRFLVLHPDRRLGDGRPVRQHRDGRGPGASPRGRTCSIPSGKARSSPTTPRPSRRRPGHGGLPLLQVRPGLRQAALCRTGGRARHQLRQEPRSGGDGQVSDRHRLRAGRRRALSQQGAAHRTRLPPRTAWAWPTGGFSGIAALNGPHKASRATFVNWFLTKKTQGTVQCLLLEQSIRNDLDSYDCIPEYVRPKPGVAYPIHDYEKGHHFGPKSELRANNRHHLRQVAQGACAAAPARQARPGRLRFGVGR